MPSSKRKPSTREKLLDTAGELLAEFGIDRVTTNLICERAGVTPPALYYYFADKYEVVVALGKRLMDRQNEALERWLDRHLDGGIRAYAENALERTNKKFIHRFNQMEQRALQTGKDLRSMSLEEMDAIWNAIKQQRPS